MSKYRDMSDDYMRDTYVPDVYQRSIYAIDYQKLKEHGIKLISFDIDDTIAGFENVRLPTSKPSKKAITLFAKLKAMGFNVVLLTNAAEERAKRFCEDLGADGYIAKAEKPKTDNFQKIHDTYGHDLEKAQIAHIGNSMVDDIAGGNVYGVTTCLVRRVGKLTAIPGKLPGKTEGQKLRDELKSRRIWRKHHKYEKDDQYYQLGETPKYRK